MVTVITVAIAIPLWSAAMIWRGGAVKWLWTIAFGVFCVHIVAAYAEYYEWSHAVAWQRTAEETARLFGIESGFGLIVNYLFLLVLAIDLVRHFTGKQSPAWRLSVDGFVILMILNGAVVFGSTLSRWIGGICLAALVVSRVRSFVIRGERLK